MRFFLLGFIFLVQTVYSQSLLDKKIDFSISEVTINVALQRLIEQTGVDIAYSKSFFKEDRYLSLHLKNQTIDNILSAILKDTFIGHKILGGRIILFKDKNTKYTVTGYIEDKLNGERLINATIYCPILNLGTITNEYGYYSITLPTEEVDIEFSYLGYGKKSESIQLTSNQHKDISLEPTLTLSEVIINPNKDDLELYTKDKSNSYQLNKKFVQDYPDLAGEEDYIRVAEFLPGIQYGIDGLGSIQVRGGDGSQNLIMMDGVQIYIPYHLLGIFSLYNPGIVKSAKVFKGSFPARYGGRTSSVLDVRVRDGNMYKWQSKASVNLMNANLVVDGPIKNEKGSFLLAGRYSPGGALMEPVINKTYFQDSEGDLKTNFYDFNAKLNYKLSSRDRIYGSFFTGKDEILKANYNDFEEIINKPETHFNWSNSIASLRWNHLFGDKMFVNTTLTSSIYGYEYTSLELSEEDDKFDYVHNTSDNREIGLKVDFDYLPNPNNTYRFGFGISSQYYATNRATIDEEDIDRLTFDEIYQESLENFLIVDTINTLEGYLYFEDQIVIKKKTQINAGMRISSFFNGNNTFLNLEPRLAIRHNITKKISAYASHNQMVQYTHLLSYSSIRLPSDFWMPSGDVLLPLKSWQTEAGIEYSPTKNLNVVLDVYYKALQNVYLYAFIYDETNEEFSEYPLKGKGFVRGLECLVNYTNKQQGAILSYNFSKTERQFKKLNKGNLFPFVFDRRHQLKVFLYQKFAKNFQLGLNWTYLSSSPLLLLTSIDGGEPLNKIELDEGEKRNNERTIPYHRLDVGLSYKFRTNNVKHRIKLGCYNIYNRENIAYYKFNLDDEDGDLIQPVNSIPFIPSIYYSISF